MANAVRAAVRRILFMVSPSNSAKEGRPWHEERDSAVVGGDRLAEPRGYSRKNPAGKTVGDRKRAIGTCEIISRGGIVTRVSGSAGGLKWLCAGETHVSLLGTGCAHRARVTIYRGCVNFSGEALDSGVDASLVYCSVAIRQTSSLPGEFSRADIHCSGELYAVSYHR
ncbi:hypothetical protein GCM10027598_61810 [Amycolatopsis oliviviridis]